MTRSGKLTALLARLRERLADPNPILVKDLRALFRTPAYVRTLYLGTAFAALVVLPWGSASGDYLAPADVGNLLFHVFFTLVTLGFMVVAPSHGATTITTERRARTFETLALSGMSAVRVVYGKFVAGYAANVLGLVTLAPIVCVAFVLGGIPPIGVLAGFVYVLLFVAPGFALGVTISARVETTWLALVLAVVLYGGLSLFGFVPSTFVVSDALQLPFDGPFWFAKEFARGVETAYGVGLLVLVPLATSLLLTTLFLELAIATLRSSGDDRSKRLKVWSAATVVPTALIPALVVHSAPSPTVTSTWSATFVVLLVLTCGVALILADEPPLPPRRASRVATSPLTRVFGPGANRTLRYAALVVVVQVVATACAMVVGASTAAVPASLDAAWRVAATYVLGIVPVALAVGGTASFFRLLLRNAAAARAITVAVFASIGFGASILTALLGPSGRGDGVPLPLYFAPGGPVYTVETILSPSSASASPDLAPNVVAALLYGAVALAEWVAIEVLCRRAARDAERRHAAFEAKLTTDGGPTTTGAPSAEPATPETPA